MTGVIISINVSWKCGKTCNIKCLFLSQMFTISGIHVIHMYELKSYCHQTTLFVGISDGTNSSTAYHDELNIFLSHPSQQASRDYDNVSRDDHWTRNRCQQPRTSTRNDVILTINLHKTQCNFDTHQSVTDMTAAVGTPWLHKLWLGLVLTTGRSSITTSFVCTYLDW